MDAVTNPSLRPIMVLNEGQKRLLDYIARGYDDDKISKETDISIEEIAAAVQGLSTLCRVAGEDYFERRRQLAELGRQHYKPDSPVDGCDSPPEELPEVDGLARKISRLPPGMKRLVELKFGGPHKKTNAEVAALMGGVKSNTVAVRLSREVYPRLDVGGLGSKQRQVLLQRALQYTPRAELAVGKVVEREIYHDPQAQPSASTPEPQQVSPAPAQQETGSGLGVAIVLGSPQNIIAVEEVVLGEVREALERYLERRANEGYYPEIFVTSPTAGAVHSPKLILVKRK